MLGSSSVGVRIFSQEHLKGVRGQRGKAQKMSLQEGPGMVEFSSSSSDKVQRKNHVILPSAHKLRKLIWIVYAFWVSASPKKKLNTQAESWARERHNLLESNGSERQLARVTGSCTSTAWKTIPDDSVQRQVCILKSGILLEYWDIIETIPIVYWKIILWLSNCRQFSDNKNYTCYHLSSLADLWVTKELTSALSLNPYSK